MAFCQGWDQSYACMSATSQNSRQVNSFAINRIWDATKQTWGLMLLCAYIQRHVLCEDDLACQPLIALVGRTGVQLCQQETCLHAHLGSLDTT